MPTNIRVNVSFAETIGRGSPNIRVSAEAIEALSGGYPNVRADLVYNEALSGGRPNVRVDLAFTEALANGYPNVRIQAVLIETIVQNPLEYPVVTAILPGFGNSVATPSIPEAANPATGATPGLAFSVHMKPKFNTRISTSVNFKSIRSPLAPYPSWEFELPYEFLSDRDQANSSLRTLMGFYCARLGAAEPFLVKVPEFFLASDATIGTADDVRLQWDFLRWIGSEYFEPVGQVDIANTVKVYLTLNETVSVPGSGPYTVTVAHAAAFVEDKGVTIGGTPLTKVASSPAAMQYSVAAGVYTFNSAQHGASAIIDYRYLVDPSAYSVTLPNKIVFGTAPTPAGARISWDGQYFFTCYFDEDMADFEKFADKLWTLQQLTFHSELLA